MKTGHVDDTLPAYVLGALEDDERQLVESHLAVCGDCRAEHQRLASLPALLELVEPRRLPPARKPPAHLEDAVVARVVSEREAGPTRSAGRSSRWRARRPVAVATLAGALAGVAATLAISGVLSGPAPERVRLAATDGSGASAEATLHRSAANTRIALEASDLAPTAEDEVYEVWLVHDGGRVSAGTFTVGDSEPVSLELNAAGPVARYERIGITREPDAADPAANGRNVVAAPIGPS
jgi:anti-sigma-K factor RskA